MAAKAPGKAANSLGMGRINRLEYEDLRDTLKEEREAAPRTDVHPILRVTIGNTVLTAIVDSGSQITAISEEAYLRCMAKQSWPTFSLKKTRIKGAIAGKHTEVTTQTRMTLSCQGHSFDINLLVVPSLSIDLIIGMDALCQYQAVLDIGRGELLLQKDGTIRIQFTEQATDAQLPTQCLRMARCDERELQMESPACNVVKAEPSSPTEITQEVEEIIEERVAAIRHIPEHDREQLRGVLHRNAQVFLPKTGAIKNFEYAFKVRDHTKFFVPPYPIPLVYREKVAREIERMLEEGIIEPAVSTYNSPLRIVEKSDGSVRLTLDSRQINTVIEPETDRPERMEELLQNFYGVKVFTSLDLRSSFWQITLHPACRQYTAFLAFGHCFQFKRLPFGLSVSTAAFIRGLNNILSESIKRSITSYVDDLLIAEPTWEAHNAVLGELLDTFSNCGVTVNITKSRIGAPEVKFLGHIITGEGIAPDPEKMEALRQFARPTTKRQLRGFLGVVNFFKRFIHVDKLATPVLCRLTGKKTPWEWDSEAEEEFLTLKNALLNAPILSHPNLAEEFCMATDSSYTGLGVMIFQRYQEGNNTTHKTIAFGSRVLTKCERNYSATELEALAVVWSFEKFRFFLYGRKTRVFTDHKALEFLMTAKLRNKRLTRWALALQEFDFTIEHVPGKTNVIADALSRSPIGIEREESHPLEEEHFSLFYMKQVAFENSVTASLKEIAREQDRDPALYAIKQKWRDRQHPNIRQFYMLRQGILFYNGGNRDGSWRLCIPDELANKVIWHTHLRYAHFGARKCFLKLRTVCHFKDMERRIRRVLSVCKKCQKAKHTTVTMRGPLYPIIPKGLRDLGAVDLLGPLPRTNRGYNYVFVAVELASKYVTFTPLRKATGVTVSKALQQDFLTEVGHVAQIISDNGPQFRSARWKATLQRNRIKPIYASARHPQSSPAERTMKDLGNLCRIYCAKRHATWDVFLKDFQEIINELPHGVTQIAPVTVLKNVWPRSIMEDVVPYPPAKRRPTRRQIVELALSRLRQAGLRRKEKWDQRVRMRAFQVGEKVLLKNFRLPNKQKKFCQKFYPAYVGPLKIRRMAHFNAAELESLKTGKSMGVHPTCHLKPFVE